MSKSKKTDLKTNNPPINIGGEVENKKKDEAPFDSTSNIDNPETNGEVASLPNFNELVEKELKKYDPITPAIEELKKEYLPLKISSLEQVEVFENVKKALRFVNSKISAIEDKRKELKADSLEYGRRVDAKAKEITALITPIKEHLAAQKAKYDELKAEQDRLEEEKKNKQKRERHDALISAGMNLVGIEYIWQSKIDANQELSLVAVNLETMNDASFNAFVKEVQDTITNEKAKLAEIEEQKRLEDEKRKEEQRKLDAEREALEAEKRKMQEEKDKLENEIRQIKEARAKRRFEVLYALGLGSTSFNPNLVFISPNKHIIDNAVISVDSVNNLSKDEYQIQLDRVKTLIESYIKEDKLLEDAKQERLIAKAKADALAAEEKAKEEAKKAEELAQKQRAEKLEADAKAEAERQLGLSDKQKLQEYIDKLLLVSAPALKTAKWNKTLSALVNSINTFKNIQ